MTASEPITSNNYEIVGWREWVALPDLGIRKIKAKLDTGAKTSALHAWDQEIREHQGESWVHFYTRPFIRKEKIIHCKARLFDFRWVTNPGGTRERRFVILTTLALGSELWNIELTLTQRDEMGFRMLLGREAMRGRVVINPETSYQLKRETRFR